jgi:iron complex transport system substrate-binding protein
MPHCVAILVLFIVLSRPAEGGQTVVDMAGNSVAVPTEVRRIGCLEVLCYEKLFLLGASDRIVMMTRTNAPWMRQTNPAVDRIHKISSEPDIEELLQYRVDVVFRAAGYPGQKLIEHLARTGVPILLSQPVDNKPPIDSINVFLDSRKRMLRLFAQVLGPVYEARAEAWCAYLDQKVEFVLARTRDIPASQRIRLFHVRGPGHTRSHGLMGQPYWYGVIAGADMVVNRSSARFVGRMDVTVEELLKWNPQVINVSRHYAASAIINDPRLQQIEAVHSKRVHELPEGVFYWDGSTEGVLMMLYLAKELYPDRFSDLDLRHEFRDYYARFYHYPLSEGELDLMLAGKGPDGRRNNDMNN